MEEQLTYPNSQEPTSSGRGVSGDPAGNAPALSLDEFEALFHQHYNYLRLTATSILKDEAAANDVVQEFYISFWNQHRVSKPNFRSYAKRAVSNDCFDLLRKQKVQQKRSNQFAVLEENSPEPEVDLLDENQQAYQEVLDLVAKLPESRRKILILHAVEQMSYVQIAEKQGVSVNTVKTQLNRAYKSLRSHQGMILISILMKF